MVIGTASLARSKLANNTANNPRTVLVPLITDWIECCNAPDVADNGGSDVINPGAIVRAETTRIATQGNANTALIRIAYDDGLTSITDPVIQVFGNDAVGATGAWYPLKNSSGTHAITLVTAASDDGVTDITDGTLLRSTWVEVECKGALEILVAVKVALTGTGTKNTSILEIKFT